MAAVVFLQADGEPDIKPDHAAVVEQTLAQGFPFLVFPTPLERHFLSVARRRRLAMILAVGLASLVLFPGMIIADAIMMPDVIGLSVALRIGVYAPVTLAGLYILHKLRMALLTEWIAASAGAFATILSILPLYASTSPWAFPAVVQLNLIVVFVCAFARFWPAVALSCFILLTHAFALATLHDATGILAPNTTLLLVTTIGFTLYGNYKLEHDERLAFLLDLREQALNAEISAARDRLARMATTDPLTGVANRRYFDEFLGDCAQRAVQEGRPLSLALVDIDYFKRYNDLYGHQAGDQCLVAVAGALNSCIRRPADLVARWGGEEFAIVMTDAHEEAAEAAGERVARAVQGLGLRHAASGCGALVSVSVGVASTVPGQPVDIHELVKRADAALYEAKRLGRNRVRRHQDDRRGASKACP